MDNIRKLTPQRELGDLGEDLVIKLFGGVKSSNIWDSEKDLTIQGQSIEVKTQVRWRSKGWFTVSLGHTNLIKCQNVDHLLFVEYDNTDIIKVWECFNRTPTEFKTRSGRCGWAWNIGEMRLLAATNNPQLAQKMRSLSKSKF